MLGGSPPAKRILKKAPKHKVPIWYRRSRTFWAGGAVLTLLVIGGLKWKFSDTSKAEDITATVKRANLSITVTERGELESSKTIDARCEVEGYQNKIVSILPEATKVKGPGWFWWEPGQVVVTFDKEKLKTDYLTRDITYKNAVGKAKAAKGELEVQTNKAEGEVADAELALKLADLERDKYLQAQYQVDAEEIQGKIELAKKELKEAEDKLEQYRKFVKKGFGTPEQERVNELSVENKKYNLRCMKGQLMVLEKFTKKGKETELTSKAAEAKRKLVRAKKAGDAAIEKAQSDLDAAEAAARVEKQALDRINDQLDKCVVRAPADGILQYSKDRWYDPSSRIQAGAMVHQMQTLFQIPDLARMQVKVKIHESMVKKVHKGQKAEITIEALAHTVLHGTVEKVGIMADTMGYWDQGGVKEYVTIIKLDELPEDAGINPGMTAQVKILAHELPDVLMVPVQAVAEKESKHYAYVNGLVSAERIEVEVGETNEKFVEIKSGLSEGQKVLLDARSRLTAETKANEKKNQPDEEPKAGEKKKEEKKAEPAPAQPSPAPAPAAPVAAAPGK
jgi:RND family efflux transporter MFP subunit